MSNTLIIIEKRENSDEDDDEKKTHSTTIKRELKRTQLGVRPLFGYSLCQIRAVCMLSHTTHKMYKFAPISVGSIVFRRTFALVCHSLRILLQQLTRVLSKFHFAI
jgi:hypothetical protein